MLKRLQTLARIRVAVFADRHIHLGNSRFAMKGGSDFDESHYSKDWVSLTVLVRLLTIPVNPCSKDFNDLWE
jgi:hypothetical protein